MKILINYSDRNFKNAQKKCLDSAKEFGNFDAVIPYTRDDLKTSFLVRNQSILSHEKGGGYWVWKPEIILSTLNQSNEGDIVFYCDSGAEWINSVDLLIKNFVPCDIPIMAYDLYPVIEKTYTKAEVLSYNQCFYNSDITDTPMRCASFQMMINNKSTIDFYKEYLLQCEKTNLINDSLSMENYPEFKEHRHDQSIYSVLTKLHKIDSYRDPSQWGNPVVSHYVNSDYPQIINHTRNRS